MKGVIALLAVLVTAVAAGFAAGSAMADGVGLCGPYFTDPTNPSNPLEYRQQLFDQTNDAGVSPLHDISAVINMKPITATWFTGNIATDFVASWVVLSHGSGTSTQWLQAGIVYGGSLGANPNIYVEVHGANGVTNGHYLNVGASLGTAYTMSVHENGTSAPWQYYGQIKQGSTVVGRYPATGYVTFSNHLNDAQWGNEEADLNDTANCNYDDTSFTSVSATDNAGLKVGGSYFTDWGNLQNLPSNQSAFALKSWNSAPPASSSFESWTASCFLQGKCMLPPP